MGNALSHGGVYSVGGEGGGEATDPAGSAGDVQYNNDGVFGGFGFYDDATFELTTEGDLAVSGALDADSLTLGTPLAVLEGGTGASDAATARSNLGAAAASHTHTAADVTDFAEVAADTAGGMFSGNTETFITATYQDGDNTVDLVVPVLDEDDFASDSAAHLATQQSIKAYVDTATHTVTQAVAITIGDGTNVIATGVWCDVRLPIAGTWTKATLLAKESGNLVVDLWLDSFANFPPTDADSITAAAPPTLSGDDESEDGTLSGWDTSFTAGDCLRVNIDSAATITLATLILDYTRTV